MRWVRRRYVSLRKGSSMSTVEASDPIGVRDLLRPPGLPFFRVGVRSRHVARRHGLAREPSAGRLARPLHLMKMDKACSAAAVRKTAFVRPRSASRITKVHSAAACAAPAQSPSAALNGYDGTVPFHHTAYAASYTAGYGKLRPGAVPTRHGMAMPDGRFPRAKQGNPGIRSPSPATP